MADLYEIFPSQSTTQNVDYAAGRYPYPRRSRTWSVCSNLSVTKNPIALGPLRPGTPTIEEQKNLDAWGSFLPLNSATVALRNMAPHHQDLTGPKTGTRPLNVTFEKGFPRESNYISSPPSPDVPFITRTLSSMPRPPSPDSSASSINLERENKGPKLHPTLARLERNSKFCVQQMVCATCRKPGRDFPQCGKCQKMWCSRECRLVNGKRHVCGSN